MRPITNFVLFLFLSTGLAFAQELPAGVTRVTSVEGITEYRLDNGLKVLLFPDPSSSKTTVNITYLVGSRHEGYGETGMAHLLEHLLFKGSKDHPSIPKELSDHGADPNGTTWYDRTNYYETFPASDENLDWALDLEADRMVNSFIAKKDLDSEMTVVRNEFEMGENSPAGILMERMFSTAFLWHNYGKSTIGARADIENVPIERLQAFYRRYYQPDNAILVVAGPIEEARTLELVQKHFGSLPRPERVLPQTYTSEPTQDGERRVNLRRVGDVQLAGVVYHIPSGSHPDFAAVDVLGQLLGDTPSGRLYKALVETKLATSVFGGAFQLREPGVFVFMAETGKDGPLKEVEKVMLETIQAVPSTPPTSEEVERAKTALLKSMEETWRNTERIGLQLSEWAAMGDWRLFFLHRDRLEKVTPEDVQRVASEYLKTSNRTVGLFMPTADPDRAEIPAVASVDEMLAGYQGRGEIARGEAFDPSPQNIESRTTRTTLPNGVELAMLPKKTRGNTVDVSMSFNFGNLQALQGHGVDADFAGAMLMRGTTEHTRQQIQDLLDQLKTSASVGGSHNSVDASIETTRENLAQVLDLVAEIMRQPAFPESEFEIMKNAAIAGLEEERSDPQSIASRALRRHLSPYAKGDPRYVPTLEEEIALVKALTLDQVRDFYRGFYGIGSGEIAVVGDFDPEAVQAQLAKLYSDWPSPVAYERLENVHKDAAAVEEAFVIPDKANAVFLASKNLQLKDTDPDYPALVLGNYILGGGFLNSRLATRVRQKEGLSYGVGSSLRAGTLDPAGRFFAYAIAAPENIPRVQTAVREEIERVLKEGYTDEEVQAAISGLLEARKVDRAQDGYLAGVLQSYLFWDRTLAWDVEFEEKIRALTPEAVREAMARYLNPAGLTVMKAGSLKG